MAISDNHTRQQRMIKLTGLVSGIFLIALMLYQNFFPTQMDAVQWKAYSYMDEMIAEVASYCKTNNIEIDKFLDPGQTGLIGPEWTEISSTLGHLDAKRTSIQAEMAVTLVTLLRESGVEKGDTIALACSGSFPGLMLASFSASKALGLDCLSILSLGSSSYGANRENLTILDIYLLLLREGLIDESLVGVSLGGEQDIGLGWELPVVSKLAEKIEQSAYPFIREENLTQSVDRRAELLGIIGESNIRVLINSGGAMANIGTSETILGLKPGLVKKMKIPVFEQQGLIHRAATHNIPVIHLLYIKGLAAEYGIPWDPPGSMNAE